MGDRTSYDYSKNPELIKLAQNGDKAAMDELLQANMGLIRSIVPRFADRGVEYEDLVQIGAIGMIKAVKSYEPGFGTVFSTYAVPLIIGEIRRFLRDDGMIKVSRTTKRTAQNAMKQKEKFMSEHGREPRISELSQICGVSEDELTDALESAYPMHSLSETVSGDDGVTLEGAIPARDDGINDLCEMMSLRDAVSRLEPEERKIIYLRYFRDCSQQQIADALGISQVKVSRTEKKIYEKLRQMLTV
ncbi:MAG: sigma-70 family RNA polymerase sigma factor [Clostridia bacterium]|jgi:RNA polymerase sporulation-specific sigma factor|nr:sigma-70 family RNA polymerase sigma factor [Clostridia bacterium]